MRFVKIDNTYVNPALVAFVRSETPAGTDTICFIHFSARPGDFIAVARPPDDVFDLLNATVDMS